MKQFIEQILADNRTVVAFYPYRRALVGPGILRVEYSQGDEIDQLRNILAERVCQPKDNHTVYSLTNWGGTVYLRFSDWSCTFSIDITKGDTGSLGDVIREPSRQ